MRGRKSLFLFLTSCLVIINMNCGTGAPDNWIRQPKDVLQETRGAWIVAEYTSADNSTKYPRGEFIGCNEDTVYVLTEAEFLSIPVSKIRSLRVTFYESHPWSIFGLTILGTAVTIPLNGLLTIFTGPIWLVGGIIATITEGLRPMYSYPSHTLKELSIYARFPQGIRPDLDRASLRFKSSR